MFLVFAVVLIICFNGCSTKGLLTERYEPDFYKVQKLLPDSLIDENPTFIVYGDTQADWRIYHSFASSDNWKTYKMLIFPFYEIYWLGKGVVGGVNWLRHHPDCDAGTRKLMREAVYAESKRSGADFILNTGDINANDGRRPDHWALFLRENKHHHPLLNEIAYLPTVGNHDRVNDTNFGLPNYQAIFGYPSFYKVEFRDVDLFVVDSDIIIDWKDELEDGFQDELFQEWFVSDDLENPAWLERGLASSGKTFKIVSMHHSPLSFGNHWKDWKKPSFGRNGNLKRRKLIETLQKHRVQVVFSGHDHIYQHNLLSYPSDDGSGNGEIHFIVSSGGGVPLRDPKSAEEIEYIKNFYHQEGLEAANLIQEKVFHYCLVEVDSTEMRIETIKVPQDPDEPPAIIEKIIIPGQ